MKTGLNYNFVVMPKNYRRGYCPSYYWDWNEAKTYQKDMERATGFEWTVKPVEK